MQKNNFLLLGFVLLFSISVRSQDFEVAPVKMKFNVDPEESQTKTLTVKNHSNFRTSFTISFEDYVIDKNGEKQAFKRNSTKTSCTEWITPEKTFFDINPNEQVEIKITMHAPVGDYSTRWALMYIQTVREKTSFEVDQGVGAGLKISGRISVEIVRNPVIPLTPKLKIKDLREVVNADSTHRYFVADVLNMGKSMAECKVTFIASDLNTAEEIEFKPMHFVSYPGFPREIQFQLPSTLPAGKYSLVALLDYGKDITIEGTRLNKPLIIVQVGDSENSSDGENSKNK